jgi:RNA polymerase sigma-70 factor (ECF subfamily)
MQNDDDLLAAVAAGDRSAFSTLFRRRRPDVYRYALHLTGDAAAADDVTQEVFLAVMRDAGRYERGRSTVVAWLCGIARNHTRRRLERDRRLVPFDVDDDDAPIEIGAAAADPLADLTKAEGLEVLRRAVLSLPLRYREAVVACDLQELSYLEAAEALGCAVGTVRSRLHRGRALLASKLGATDRGTAAAREERPPQSGRVRVITI